MNLNSFAWKVRIYFAIKREFILFSIDADHEIVAFPEYETPIHLRERSLYYFWVKNSKTGVERYQETCNYRGPSHDAIE